MQKLLRVSDQNGDKKIRKFLHHLYYTVYLEKRASGQQNKNMFEIMLTELEQFEENFRDYIDSISEKVTSDIKYKKIYTQNYKRLRAHLWVKSSPTPCLCLSGHAASGHCLFE